MTAPALAWFVHATSANHEGRPRMPLYSYHCKKCDTDMELLVSLSGKPVCSSCGGEELERLMSRPAAHGKSDGLKKAARAQAGRAGHLSNFSRSERRR
jgi:putative FmdB family regulatory protein